MREFAKFGFSFALHITDDNYCVRYLWIMLLVVRVFLLELINLDCYFSSTIV